MTFIPQKPVKKNEIPYFEEASAKDGWQGHTTTKKTERLIEEVIEAIKRLGGAVTLAQRGTFDTGDKKGKRVGFRLEYTIVSPDGKVAAARTDIAALPIRSMRGNYEKRREQSLRMALYMLEIALSGTWFLQYLSPGYAPLMPFMLVDEEHTVSQLWSKSSAMQNLLPPGDSEFIEGEYKEV